MTPHQSVAVALRLFAIWLGLQTLRTLPSVFADSSYQSPGFVWMTFMLGLSVLLILVLWFFPGLIAGKLVRASESQPVPSASPDMWLAVGCTLLGLWILTATLPRLIYDLIALNVMSYLEDQSQLKGYIRYNFIEVAIALWLILGAKGVRKVFWWAQNTGVRKDL